MVCKAMVLLDKTQINVKRNMKLKLLSSLRREHQSYEKQKTTDEYRYEENWQVYAINLFIICCCKWQLQFSFFTPKIKDVCGQVMLQEKWGCI